MEHKIGEIFEFDGEWYQCIRSSDCRNCDLKNIVNCRLEFPCETLLRKDGEEVIFKKLEKVGLPYMIGNKLIQRYKIYPTTCCINVYGWYYQNLDINSWTIDIEIKQTKEDMEEKKTNFVEEIEALCKRYNMSDGVLADFISEMKEIIKDKDKKHSLKPFDLEAAKQGKPVCTRNGRKARIICFNAKRKDGKSIIALVPSKDYPGFEDLIAYPNNGNYHGGHENDGDLMMLPEKKEGWVNIYYEHDAPSHREASWVYDKEEEAIKVGKEHGSCYIATVRIEWGE